MDATKRPRSATRRKNPSGITPMTLRNSVVYLVHPFARTSSATRQRDRKKRKTYEERESSLSRRSGSSNSRGVLCEREVYNRVKVDPSKTLSRQCVKSTLPSRGSAFTHVFSRHLATFARIHLVRYSALLLRFSAFFFVFRFPSAAEKILHPPYIPPYRISATIRTGRTK